MNEPNVIQPPEFNQNDTKDARDIEYAIAIIAHWKKVLNARLLAVIALLGALAVFFFTIYDPSSLRLWASSLYSVGVLLPTIGLYLRKG